MSFKNTTLKIGLGAAILGLGILTACGDKESGVASSYSETNTGTPIAQLDTAGVEKEISEVVGCDFEADNLEVNSKVLTKFALAMTEDTTATKGKTADGREYVDIVFRDCGEEGNINFFMDVRGQVVDKSGAPVANVIVQSNLCGKSGKTCSYTTDQDGFFYEKHVRFMTYELVDVRYADSNEWVPAYISYYSSFEAKIESAGVEFYGSFEESEVIEVDGTKYVNMGKIVLFE